MDKFKIHVLENSNTVTHDIKMNEQLKENLISNIPEDFNQLEKSIYLYIKLCQIFSYDDVYYYNDKTETHRNVSNILDYNEKNNKVVCYEFAYIYSDLLRSIRINHIKEKETKDDRFDKSHANIEF